MVHCCSRRDSGLPDFAVDCMMMTTIGHLNAFAADMEGHSNVTPMGASQQLPLFSDIFDSSEVISSLYCMGQYNFRGIKETPSQPKRTIRPAPTTKMATGSPKGRYFTRDAVMSAIQESNEEISVGHQINFHPVLTFYN